MTLVTVNLIPRIATELKCDLATLVSGAHSAELRALLERRGVLVVRGLNMEDDDQLAFAQTLGTVRLGAVRKEGARGITKVTFDNVANPERASYHFRGTFYWHMDGIYDDVPPLASVLTPRVLAPSGGQTEFANTYASYDELPEADKQRFATLKVVHTLERSYRHAIKNPTAEELADWRRTQPKAHPLVWHHRSGRKSLALGTSADYIVGMDRKESDALLDWIMNWMTQPQFVYQHHWKMGDLLMWDNTGTMHRVLPFDMECGRRLHRVTLEGEEPLAAA
jgi:alpha-ketoglutarate-dependent taurine dioxygenase